jgi:uncharacterized protein involved in type VI secretion and phage assembly
MTAKKTVTKKVSGSKTATPPEVVSTTGTGIVPGAAGGMVIGKVRQLSNDPLNENRILVQLPWPDGSTKELWARVATLYATQGAGSFFLPEAGDEVVVGFFNQDLNCPVILGSLIGSKQTPAYARTEQNPKKAIVTREKLKIEFVEEKKIISIETPGNNQLVISDEGKSIKLSDQNGNMLSLDSNGITLSSAKDIILKSKGNVIIDSVSNVNIGSKSDIVLNGLNVKATAQVGFTGKGNATAELSASGTTTVKGALIMIN